MRIVAPQVTSNAAPVTETTNTGTMTGSGGNAGSVAKGKKTVGSVVEQGNGGLGKPTAIAAISRYTPPPIAARIAEPIRMR